MHHMEYQAMRHIQIVILLSGALSVFIGACGTVPSPPPTVAIGTFNIEWLGDGIEPEQKPRTEEDYQAIATLIAGSGVNVLAVQEIENDSALRRLLRYLPGWQGMLGRGGHRQNVGVLYDSTVQCRPIGDYYPLAVNPERNRAGFVAECRKGPFDWLMMVVHLKSSSRYDSTDELRRQAIEQRRQQAAILRRWADSVLQNSREQDVLIVGDFNDYPRRSRQPTLGALEQDSALVFLTAGMTSCLDHRRNAIDHIVASLSAARRWIADRRRMVNHQAMLPPRFADRISDHCLVVGEFELQTPDND
ncbi:MAG: endonuclease/exonuclease/phosphatase family protein [Bacteroidota bacterium]|nr:endonuclease/exonuclease/phosphatase family protein [Bacteroidota bacterium]